MFHVKSQYNVEIENPCIDSGKGITQIMTMIRKMLVKGEREQEKKRIHKMDNQKDPIKMSENPKLASMKCFNLTLLHLEPRKGIINLITE